MILGDDAGAGEQERAVGNELSRPSQPIRFSNERAMWSTLVRPS
jgi:hypothetical protein